MCRFKQSGGRGHTPAVVASVRVLALYCTVLYCTVLYCTVLHYAALCFTILSSRVALWPPRPVPGTVHSHSHTHPHALTPVSLPQAAFTASDSTGPTDQIRPPSKEDGIAMTGVCHST
jgi:hypothetical protein